MVISRLPLYLPAVIVSISFTAVTLAWSEVYVSSFFPLSSLLSVKLHIPALKITRSQLSSKFFSRWAVALSRVAPGSTSTFIIIVSLVNRDLRNVSRPRPRESVIMYIFLRVIGK